MLGSCSHGVGCAIGTLIPRVVSVAGYRKYGVWQNYTVSRMQPEAQPRGPGSILRGTVVRGRLSKSPRRRTSVVES